MHNQDADTTIGMVVAGVLPLAVAAALVPLRDTIVNANVALALVVTVVIAAVVGGRGAGAFAALMATLAFDFFHVQPYLSLTIDSQDDVETTALLLVVGLVVGTLASRAKRAIRSAEAGRSEVLRIHRLAEKVAAGDPVEDVILAAERELVQLLGLRDSRFEAPPYGDSVPRLERTGVVAGQQRFRVAATGFELPREGVELPVLARGQQVGRFVLLPTPEVGATLEQRVVAVALADQVGAALAVSPPPVGQV